MDFGKKLKFARNYRDLTMRDLAEQIGVGSSTIGDWERNASWPNLKKLILLMEALNVDANYFFIEDAPIEPKEEPENTERDRLYRKYQTLSQDEKDLVNNLIDVLSKPR